MAIGAVRPAALVVHAEPHFEVEYSELLRVLRRRHGSVSVFSAGESSGVETLHEKEFVFELIVFAASKAAECFALAERLRLPEFYDRGGRLLLLGDDGATQGWRLLLGFLGLDVLLPEEVTPRATLQADAHSRVLAVEQSHIALAALRQGLARGLLFEGQALRLTPRETQHVGVLVRPPPRALLVAEGGEGRQVRDATAALVAFGQGRYVKARMAAAGSARMFSNELMRRSDWDNLGFLENLLDWLAFKSMSFTVQRFAFCAQLEADCAPATSFRRRLPFFARFQVVDAAGQQVTDPAGLYLQLRLTTPVLAQPPRVEALNGELFFVVALPAFERIGVYRSRVLLDLPGGHLDAAAAEHEVVVRIEAEGVNDIFLLEALPFLCVSMLVLLSAATVFWLALPRPKAAKR